MRAASTRSHYRSVVRLAVVPAVGALLLTACGGSDSSASNAADGGAMESSPVQGSAGGAAGERAAGDDSAASDGRTSARVLPMGRDIVYRGEVTVRVRDVSRAAGRVESHVLSVEGLVFSEQTSAAPGRRGLSEATLSLRVPPTQFSSTLDALGRLGKELHRSRSAQDVTAELADTDSRVRSQERSVARVRALLAEADTIGEVVQVEAELSRREADLESLQAQLAKLKDVTEMATIDVTLVAWGVDAPPEPEDDDLGFLSGLRGGWAAFVGIVLVALTVLGAVIPFALAGLMVGVPAYVLLRSRRRSLRPPSTEPAA